MTSEERKSARLFRELYRDAKEVILEDGRAPYQLWMFGHGVHLTPEVARAAARRAERKLSVIDANEAAGLGYDDVTFGQAREAAEAVRRSCERWADLTERLGNDAFAYL